MQKLGQKDEAIDQWKTDELIVLQVDPAHPVHPRLKLGVVYLTPVLELLDRAGPKLADSLVAQALS